MDKYTKFLLTLIALSLMWISIQTGAIISSGYAAFADTKIEIVDVTVAKHRVLPVYVTGEIKCK